MALATLIHVVISTLAAMALALFFGRMNAGIALISLEAGAAAGIWTWWRFRKEERLFPEVKLIPGLFYGFVIFAGLQHFLYLLFYNRHGLRTLHLNNFGDLAMHIQYIRNLAGADFWPENPGFAGSLLRYPLGMDLYNALWEAVGVPIDSHLFVVGIAMTVAAVSMLHRWMGWLGVGAFFLNGGLVNWKALYYGRLFDFQNEAAWKNFLLSLWITQRGFLFAIPAGVYVIKMVTEVLVEQRSLSRQEKVACAVLWSGLAWFHLHTFFILSLALGSCILLYRKFRPLLGILIPVAFAGLVFGLFSTSGLSQVKVFRIQWGWVAGNAKFYVFWLTNLGPWLLLAAATIYFVFKEEYSRFRGMAIVYICLFIVFTFVIVAPWDWDNIKVLLWLYLLIVSLSWKIWLSRLQPAAAFLTGCILLIPGAISVLSSLPGNNEGAQVYQTAELSEAKAALRDLDRDAVLAVLPIPNHPAMFWGVRVAEGYPGHMWSHGIDSTERERNIDKIFRGEDWLATAKSIGVTHIYWGQHERQKYGFLDQPWKYQLKNVSRSSKIDVYDVRTFSDSLSSQPILRGVPMGQGNKK